MGGGGGRRGTGGTISVRVCRVRELWEFLGEEKPKPVVEGGKGLS